MAEQNDYFRIICKVSRAFGTADTEDALLDLVVQSAVESMHTKAAVLFLLDEEQGVFVAAAQKGLSDRYVRFGLTQPQKVIPELLKKGYVFARDAATDPRLDAHEVKKSEGIASILAVPALIRGKLVGGLAILTDSPRDFSDKEIEFMCALAEQGCIAIEHARLVEQTRDNTRLFLDLSVHINSSLDLKTILHILTADVAEAFQVKAASILLLNEDTGRLEYVASYGLSETYLKRGPLYVEKSVEETLTGKAVFIQDVLADERVQYKKEKEKEGIVSILSIPVQTKEKVIGVLRLYAERPREFTADEILLATALANMGGIAIQNASMFLMLQTDMKDLRAEIWSHRSWF
jgi:GAF domain-containing protein